MINRLLLAVFVILPIVCAWRSSVSRRGFELNHVTLFTLGFVFYWVLPIAAGESGVFGGNPFLGWWYTYYRQSVTPGPLRTYLVYATLIYVAFVVATGLGRRVAARDEATDRAVLAFAPKLLAVPLALSVVLLALLGWRLRGELFTGYSGGIGAVADVDGQRRGPLAATTLVLLNLLLLRLAVADARGAPRRGLLGMLRDPYVLCFAAAAAMLLSLGVRLYAITGTLALVSYLSVFRQPLTWRAAAVMLVLVVGVGGAVGSLRFGASVSLVAIGAGVAMEPLFTSFSLLSFIRQDEFPLFNFPRFVLGDLINLIPSAVLPGKSALLVRPEDYGYVVYAPVGALSSFFSTMINFGLVGTMMLTALLGFSLPLLRAQRAALPRVVYAMVSACLGFTVFRDPFSVSLIKNILQFSIITPLAAAAILHVVTVTAGRPPGRPAVHTT